MCHLWPRHHQNVHLHDGFLEGAVIGVLSARCEWCAECSAQTGFPAVSRLPGWGPRATLACALVSKPLMMC